MSNCVSSKSALIGKGISIRELRDEDIPNLMKLFNSCVYPPKTEYAFRWWKKISAIALCAVHEDEIIGTFFILRRKLVNGMNCGVLMGLLVKDEWRRAGLFKEMGEIAMKQCSSIDLFCCFPNLPGKRALENNFNFQTIGVIETMVRHGNPGGDKDEHDLNEIGRESVFRNFEVPKDDTMMFLADNDFRLWRFSMHPRCLYKLLRADSGEFIIAGFYYDDGTETRYGDIADFETASLDKKSFYEMIEYGYERLGRSVDAVTIQAIPGSVLYNAARGKDFMESGVRHHFCVKVKTEDNINLYDSSRWIIKWGDFLR